MSLQYFENQNLNIECENIVCSLINGNPVNPGGNENLQQTLTIGNNAGGLNIQNVGILSCNIMNVNSEIVSTKLTIDGDIVLDQDGTSTNRITLRCTGANQLNVYGSLSPLTPADISCGVLNCTTLNYTSINPRVPGTLLASGTLNNSSSFNVNVSSIKPTSTVIFNLASASAPSLASGIDFLGVESINTSVIPYGFTFYVGAPGTGTPISAGQTFNYMVFNT